MTTRRGALGLIAGAALIGCAEPSSAVTSDEMTLEAAGIGPMRVSVSTPPGYRLGAARHPVLYMHDGQNLFDPAVSGYGKVWHVDRAVERLELGDRAPIVVGIWNPGAARFRTYVPQPIVDRLPAAVTAGLAERIGGPVQSAAYLDFLAGPLKTAIDRRYRTRTGRSDTFVMGSSMGGLISLHALVRHPQVFGAAGCLSSHWPLFIPEGEGEAPFRAEVTRAWTGWLGEALGSPAGRRIWFDHGTATLDRLYAPYQAAVDRALPPLGWRAGRDFTTRVYPGAPHEENAWAARLTDPLAWLYRQPSRG
ncbi:hypothetical protein COC42_02365 [Sphingomonas spermidinifaciens]|uniref:Esterase n=1 Tax=Sphingomonas spermidinifaciens TaxID=1141889 RepID=A0A2A4B5P8_9SPHN|nr:alpha/beta hydrolase-fold protein [Sphingomonas spermidinifaciens]PCD03272.1 hypothetical protein COC42_02365 [Sphingomonas spermidinifaciens]